MSELICKKCKVRDCECVPYDVECDSCHRAYQQGAKDFAEWLSNTEYVANHDSFILPLRGYFTVDEVVAEWQKGDDKK